MLVNLLVRKSQSLRAKRLVQVAKRCLQSPSSKGTRVKIPWAASSGTIGHSWRDGDTLKIRFKGTKSAQAALRAWPEAAWDD